MTGAGGVDCTDESLRPGALALVQEEVAEICEADRDSPQYSAILEYELPLESRRPDVVLLVRGAVVVLELKGKQKPSRADLDQVAAYARDLACYKRGAKVRDPLQLRVNAYRALLTRGRDATVVFVPELPELDATYEHLLRCGFRLLETSEPRS